VGDPRLPNVRMGPVASLSQRREVLEQLAKLKREAEVVYGDTGKAQPVGADADRGAFVSPTLLYCRDAGSARAVHSVEAFGPVCTLVPYHTVEEAIALARRSAVQGTPDVVTAVTGRWVRGARELQPGTHPFRKPFGQLAIGDTFNSAEREVTLEDIERFADLSGDRFYAHMDEAAAARNPL